MQTAYGLRAEASEIVMAARPDPQDHRLVFTGHFAKTVRPQRCDRDRSLVVLVGLVDLAAVEQPHPRAELGRHVDDPFARGDELLGQQLPEPACAFNGPGALRPAIRPLPEPFGLPQPGPTRT